MAGIPSLLPGCFVPSHPPPTITVIPVTPRPAVLGQLSWKETMSPDKSSLLQTVSGIYTLTFPS